MQIKPDRLEDLHSAIMCKYTTTTLSPLVKARRHFLTFFLNVGYYLCVIPYKIVEAADGSSYKAVRFIPQQVICGIIHVAAIYDVATFFRRARYTEVSSNPKLYFEIFMFCVHCSVLIVFSHSMWKSSEKFCKLVRSLQKCPIVSFWYPRWINPVMMIVTIIYVTMAMLIPIFKEKPWTSFMDLFKFHWLRGRYLLFLTNDPSFQLQSNMANSSEFISKIDLANGTGFQIDFWSVTVALFSFFCSAAQNLLVYHVDLLMNVMALVLWNATSYFTRMLKDEYNCKGAMMNYEVLKYLSILINSIGGGVTLVYTVDSILFYSISLETLFTGINWFANAVVIMFFISSVSWLNFASTACLQMDRFREWVRQGNHQEHISSASISVMLLLDELQTNAVGLSGHGLFTINYKFVAQALTTLMTYFIIVIQFNK